MHTTKYVSSACAIGALSSLALLACGGGNDGATQTNASAGTSSSASSTGGSSTTGGTAGTTTNPSLTGGVAAVGGSSTSSPSGGAGTGGSSHSPVTTSVGGASTGGRSATSTGGAVTGGSSSSSTGTGGRATGGAETGTGGKATGGAGTGAATGGGPMSTGGQAPGGATYGGTSATGGKTNGGGSGGVTNGGSTSASTLPPITDYSQKGPFATTTENNVGPSKYTIYRPNPLGANGFLHAPIVFGPGIGQQVTVHATMLTNFASHGFVVVGTPVLNGGPGDAGNLKIMQDALSWIVQQNTTQGSIYQGKLWADHAVSMGFSVGGTSAVQLGGQAAVFTVVSIHGHAATAALHGPMLQTTGTNDTVGMPLQQQTYTNSQVQTFLATLTGAAHTYIESNGGGNERPPIVAWMRYWIYGDTGARHYFWGDDCVLCVSPWTNPQRKNWQ